MRNDEAPQQYVVPWAQDGQRREVIDDTPAGSNRASWKKGFPSKTMIPLAQGGMPPDGKDINGALYDLSQAVIWFYSGARYPFSQAYADSINGYPQGAWIASSDHSGIWMSMLNENKQDPESGNTGQWLPVHFRGHTEFTQLRGGEYTLREIEAARRIILLRGTLDADLTIVVPTWDTNYSIINEMSGGHDVYVKTSQSSKSLRLGVQSSRFVYCDGKECYREGSEGISLQDVRDQIKANELGGVMRTQSVNGHRMDVANINVTPSDVFSLPEDLSGRVDLNDFKTPGIYKDNNSSGNNERINYPKNEQGVLVIYKMLGENVFQVFYSEASYSTYKRVFSNGKWGDWVIFYDNKNKPSPNEIGAVPAVRRINGHDLSSDITIGFNDIDDVLSIQKGGTGGKSKEDARKNIGLGDSATLNTDKADWDGVGDTKETIATAHHIFGLRENAVLRDNIVKAGFSGGDIAKPYFKSGGGTDVSLARANDLNALAKTVEDTKITRDNVTIAGFKNGNKTAPYFRHADNAIVDLARLEYVDALNTNMDNAKITRDNVTIAGFVNGNKFDPYFRHSSGEVVPLSRLAYVEEIKKALTDGKVDRDNITTAGFLNGLSSSPYMSGPAGQTLLQERATSGSTTTNGTITFPNVITMQYGSYNYPDITTVGTFTIPFNEPWTRIMCVLITVDSGQDVTAVTLNVTSSNFQVRIREWYNGTFGGTIRWFALGFK